MTLIHSRKSIRRTVPDFVDRHVAARLRLRRLQLGISETDAARRFRMTVRKLGQVEAGEIPIEAVWLDVACGLLGVRLSYFFRGLPGLSQLEQNPRAADIQKEVVLERSRALVSGSAVLDHGAAAEANAVTISRQPGFGSLPLLVMQEQRLVEKHARAAGIRDLTVRYVSFNNGAVVNDALIAGRIQIAAGGVPPFLILWDRTRADVGVKALSATSSAPQYLVTRNPNVRTIADFSDQDRINVLAPHATTQAILLEMASAKAFGLEHYNRLDRLTVGVPHADSMAQLISGRGAITADFITPPFAYEELDAPGIRLVLRAEDLMGGPSTTQLLYTTAAFYDENPKTIAAITAALNEAIAVVKGDRRLAGEVFLNVEGKYPLLVSRMVDDLSIRFSADPQGLMKYAGFMHQIGSVKAMPASWKDLFFPAQAERLTGD